MADLSLIRDLYRRMSNDQLVDRYANEQAELTPEAISVLKEELFKRNIDIEKAKANEDKKRTQQQRLQEIEDYTGDNGLDAAWKFIFFGKLRGMNDVAIEAGLVQQGFSSTDANLLVSNAEKKCRELLDKYDGYIFYGFLAFIIGLGITIGTFILARKGAGVMIIAWGLILVGGARFLVGLTERGKYRRLLTTIRKPD